MVMATSSAGPSAVVDPSSSENSFLESAYEGQDWSGSGGLGRGIEDQDMSPPLTGNNGETVICSALESIRDE